MMRELIKCAEKILKSHLDVKPSEVVGLVVDIESRINDSFIAALDKLGYDYRVIKITPERNNSEPIPEAVPELEVCDAVVAPTSKSISHCPETTALRKRGKRFITLPGILEDVFLKILHSDIDHMIEIEKKVHDKLKKAKEIMIKTKSGTNITLKMDTSRPWKGSKAKLESGELMNLPTGEIFTAPLEEGANGTIVIDRWRDITPDMKATIEVDGGKIVSWNEAARPYVDCLKKGGENGLIIAEFGVGSNKSHKGPIGNTLHDEKIYGTVHIAFGLNTSFGGKNVAKVHQDVIILSPQIFADGVYVEY